MLPPPSAKHGLMGLPYELLLFVLAHLWDPNREATPHWIACLPACRCSRACRARADVRAGRLSALRLKDTCRFMRWSLQVPFYTRAFDDRETGPRLLGWAALHGRAYLLAFGLTRPGLDATTPTRDSRWARPRVEWHPGAVVRRLTPSRRYPQHVPRQRMRGSRVVRRRPPFGLDRAGFELASCQAGALSPLHLAVISREYDVVETLVGRPDAVNRRDDFGSTPLCYARDERLVRTLLAAGACPLEADASGYIPLAYMLKRDLWPRRAKGSDEPERSFPAFLLLLDATRTAGPGRINSYMGKIETETLLCMALLAGTRYVQALLEAGADPCLCCSPNPHIRPWRSVENDPPILIAATETMLPERLATIQALVASGARVDEVCSGRSPLQLLARGKSDDPAGLECARWLVEKGGADVNLILGHCAVDLFEIKRLSRTALARAIEHNHDSPYCLWLREQATRADRVLPLGHDHVDKVVSKAIPRTALLEAITAGRVEIVELLLSLGAIVHAATAPVLMVSIFGVLLPGAELVLPNEASGEIARMLVKNGVDPYVSRPRTTHIVTDEHVPSSLPHVLQGITTVELRKKQHWVRSEGRWPRKIDTSWEFDPSLGAWVTHTRSPVDSEATNEVLTDDASIFELWKGLWVTWPRVDEPVPTGPPSSALRRHQHHRSWTTLHTLVMDHDATRLDVFLSTGADPACGLALASQMRNTPLGVLIRARAFCYADHGPIGPWTERQIGVARRLLVHYGPAVTARFPPGLMAEFLAHWVARTGGVADQETAIREFARLTDHEGRWGVDGVSGLLGLVRRQGFWRKFARKSGRCVLEDGIEEVDGHLLQAARIIAVFANQSSRVAEEIRDRVCMTGRWARPACVKESRQHQPLAESEYAHAFSVLFDEDESLSVT